MNKFIKCWVFILCLLFIFLIIFTDRVNALNFDYVYKGEQQIFNEDKTIDIIIKNNDTTNQNVTLNIDFRNQYSNINYGFAMFNFDNIMWNNENVCYGSSCAGVQLISLIQQYNLMIQLKTSGSWTMCQIENNMILCPIPQNVSLIGLSIKYRQLNGNSHNSSNVMTIYFNRFMKYYDYIGSSNTQSIINNQNQNAQQQHQDVQNINNSITNSDVTGNNSSNSITSIGNTFNTQEDFLLNLLTIPYTLWTSILNVFSNSCAPLDVGTMFNYHLVFPCIELNDFLGGIYATIIDVIFTAIIYSAFIRRVIKYFRELLTLDEHALITGGVKLW